MFSKTKVLGLNILKFFQGVSKQAKEDFYLADVQANMAFLINVWTFVLTQVLSFSLGKLGKWWFYVP